ncbi:MAG: hypothetical protein ACWGNB_05725 [Thiogranum sp.]
MKCWLDDLPFLDLRRSARLAGRQLQLINRQSLPSAGRLAILDAFLATYQRLREALSGCTTNTDQLQAPKQLCQNIGFGYKIVARELACSRSGLPGARNQLARALLGAIHVLGLQLLDCYSTYRRAPRTHWSECLALYACAWQHNCRDYSAVLPGFGQQQLDTRFRLTALLRFANPYGQPPDTVAALHSYLERRVELTGLYADCPSPRNCFRIDQVFQPPVAGQNPNLYLEAETLLAAMQADLVHLQQHRQSSAIGLPEEVPAVTLLQALKRTRDLWLDNPRRATPREDTHVSIELVTGLEAAYCVINQGRCFDPALFVSHTADHTIDVGTRPGPEFETRSPPLPVACTSMNRSSGGLAVRCAPNGTLTPRVGQLVALRRAATSAAGGWVLAVCRWLVQSESDGDLEIGLQYLTRAPRAVVVRADDGNGLASDYQAALCATQKRGAQSVQTLIVRSGELHKGSLITIFSRGRQQSARCSELLESGPGFERYIYAPH